MNPLAAIVLVLGLLGALMLGVRRGQSGGRLSPELARKLVHLGMGTVCLAFPWLFDSAAPVRGLAGLAVAALLAVRGVEPLRRRFGGVLGGVGRASLGEIYFPLTVALVFTLAGGTRALFWGPVAILTYADAAGALVGKRWGRKRYRAVESLKTLEGSAAVLGVTWVVAMLAIGFGSSASWLEMVLGGLIIGAFAALVEAVSWRGLDNLLVPLVALAQLRIYPALSWPDLAGRAIVMGLLAGFMLNWRKHLLDSSARLGAALAMYLFWSLGDWRWLVAPALLLASYARLMPTVPGGPDRHYLAAVLCIGSAGITWAFLAAWAPAPHWLWLYTLGLATHQAIIAAVRFSQGRAQWRPWQWWIVAVLQAVAVQGCGFLVANGLAALTWREFALGAAAVATALAGFMAWDRELALPEDLNARWWRQGVTAVLASGAAFVFLRR